LAALPIEERRAIRKAREEKFQQDILSIGRRIVEVGDDGNCLFRSIALQAYGEEDQHRLVRIKCMKYIETERKYFHNFIEGNFQDYIDRKRTNGEWGDDVELQAMSEIYDRPIEIYAYDKKPMKTFHEQPEAAGLDGAIQAHDAITPFRLSFHGNSHYNCIVPLAWNAQQAVLGDAEPGVIEDEAVQWAIDDEKAQHEADLQMSD